MSFITEDFLLRSETAKTLYHSYAEGCPIVDYHCHLPPEDVAKNRVFKDLTEIWLEGDHYKWRAMRANGIDERFITGSASSKEKFLAFAQTIPQCLRNPLYHWSHLELKRYFGIDTLISPETAEAIWDEANAKLKEPAMSAHGILERFKVSVVCTTDDPVDELVWHKKISTSGIGTRVYPTFRPDKAMQTTDATKWNHWVDALEKTADTECGELDGFLSALENRHNAFHAIGGRLSDHGLEACPSGFVDRATASDLFRRLRSGDAISDEEANGFAAFLMDFFGELDADKGWTKQLHLGAMRNNNDHLFQTLGPDVGGDSIGDFTQGRTLSAFLGRLALRKKCPKTVLYNLNPADNYLFATMAGNYQDGKIAGKIQFGSGWWFLDQKEAMIWQMNALSNNGLLGKFVGMLTDSRSFLSYTRHEYFRRILCQLIGEDVDNGELPKDMNLLGNLVHNVCYGNAAQYFGFELGTYQKD